MRAFTSDELQKLRRLFRLPISVDYRDQGEILNKVLNFDWYDCDWDRQMSYQTFKDFLYVNNIPSFKKVEKELSQQLFVEKKKYHYIHSFGNNGKTTFINQFILENFNSADYYIIDFKIKNSNSGTLDDKYDELTRKCVYAIDKFYTINPKVFIRTTRLINKILITHKRKINKNKELTQESRDFGKQFIRWFPQFLAFLDQCEKDNEELENSPDAYGIKHSYFDLNYENFISSLLEEKNISSKEMFTFIIVACLLGYGDVNMQNVFVLDNIDDIYSYTSEFVTRDIVPQVGYIIDLYNQFIPEEIDENSRIVNLLDRIHFIFLFRSANFVSTLSHIFYQGSETERSRHITETPNYALTTVKKSSEILEKKINFYLHLLSSTGIKPFIGLNGLIKSINCYENHTDSEFSYILKLWNGNKTAFNRFLFYLAYKGQEFNQLFDNDDLWNSIKRGISIHLVIDYFRVTTNQDNTSSFSKAIAYSIHSHAKDTKSGRCNLQRLFISYIINNQKFDDITNNENILLNGISLESILNSISSFKKKNGEGYYLVDDFIELFEALFFENIDKWSHMVICTLNLKSSETSSIKRKYDFREIIHKYFQGDTELLKLKDIKFYTNSNAKYFILNVKRHFEYFAASIFSNPLPLPLRLKFINIETQFTFHIYDRDSNYIMKRKILKGNYNLSNIEFIKKTIDKIEESCNSTVDFYINAIMKFSDPKDYCETSGFAINNSFYFEDVISRSIHYLDDIRHQVLTNKLPIYLCEPSTPNSKIDLSNLSKKKAEQIKISANMILINAIQRLFLIFDSQVLKLLNKDSEILVPELHLSKTVKAFKRLKTRSNKILKSKFTDFQTRINHERKKKIS